MSAQNKHTPGPWTINVNDFNNRLPGWAYILQEEMDIYEKANASDNDEDMERANDIHKANALLIAAAPELLEALESIATRHLTGDEAFEIARAALSKARGQ